MLEATSRFYSVKCLAGAAAQIPRVEHQPQDACPSVMIV